MKKHSKLIKPSKVLKYTGKQAHAKLKSAMVVHS